MDKNTKLDNSLTDREIKISKKDLNLDDKNSNINQANNNLNLNNNSNSNKENLNNNSNLDTNSNNESLNNTQDKNDKPTITTTSIKIMSIISISIMGFIVIIIFLLAFALSANEIAEDFKEFTTLYPLASLIIRAIISLLILYLILKRFFKKQKILLSFTILIILTLIFVRAVPDYSNKYGISLTTIFGKEKYKQGYCLKENRILPKEELYKKAVLQYLKKRKTIDKKVDYYLDSVGINEYYIDENFTIDNWEEYLKEKRKNMSFFLQIIYN
ncbi:putative membrane protein [Campylobacter blaseri]|uniref:Uncharacterized protein n=1 Tax=Campylobacter blaseri TaxID=2042961 RepID=A0A2P8R0G6_9BACT|nr:hypothetical protein [Campylobacter blaseri]PSM51982.1 hypothetical protein CQ405_05310 [Campylobacter blaseri]PSM53767.1 hypothetical protein CRN67_05310 [Campylobacter blaseri]QKF85679.1 putative membrane protein [Campylobacter blaseri]